MHHLTGGDAKASALPCMIHHLDTRHVDVHTSPAAAVQPQPPPTELNSMEVTSMEVNTRSNYRSKGIPAHPHVPCKKTNRKNSSSNTLGDGTRGTHNIRSSTHTRHTNTSAVVKATAVVGMPGRLDTHVNDTHAKKHTSKGDTAIVSRCCFSATPAQQEMTKYGVSVCFVGCLCV